MMDCLIKDLRALYEKAKGYQQNQSPSPGYSTGRTDGFYAGVRYVFDKIAEQSNNPLTLEELREMDGEPVWISSRGISRYDICCGCTTDNLVQFYKLALPGWDYGKTWLAYHRKPEEGENATA